MVDLETPWLGSGVGRSVPDSSEFVNLLIPPSLGPGCVTQKIDLLLSWPCFAVPCALLASVSFPPHPHLKAGLAQDAVG